MGNKIGKDKAKADEPVNASERRALLKKLGRFAAVSAPTVTLLLSAKAKPARAGPASVPAESSLAFKTRIGPVDADAVLAAVKTLRLSRT